MESNLLGMRQLRQYIDSNLGTEMLDLLIEEAELKIAEVKRNVSSDERCDGARQESMPLMGLDLRRRIAAAAMVERCRPVEVSQDRSQAWKVGCSRSFGTRHRKN
jgi:hypothetical protein